MDHVWSEGAAGVRAVHEVVGVPRRITLNTVQSTMERLYRKGLLAREKVSHAYIYRARVSREEFGAAVVSDVVRSVLGGKMGAMLPAFVDLAARSGREELDRLERLIAERRRSRRP